MRQWIIAFVLALALLLTPVVYSANLLTVYNPFTGKFDFIRSTNMTGETVIASYFIGDASGLFNIPGVSGSAGDKWVDGGTYIYPNSTYGSNVKIWGSISALDWSNASRYINTTTDKRTSNKLSTYANLSKLSTYVNQSKLSTYANKSLLATYANLSKLSTYANKTYVISKLATYANLSKLSTYTNLSRLSTYVNKSLLTTYANKSLMQSSYVNRSTWTSIDSYPAACGAGQYVSQIGDTLTCGTPTDTNTYNSSAQMRAAVNITNAIYLFIAKNITGVLADRQVVDTITASNYVRRSTWTDIDSYPSACAAGQYVTAIGDTLTCDTPAGGTGGGAGDKWIDGGTYITPNTTYASNVKVWGYVAATDWSNASSFINRSINVIAATRLSTYANKTYVISKLSTYANLSKLSTYINQSKLSTYTNMSKLTTYTNKTLMMSTLATYANLSKLRTYMNISRMATYVNQSKLTTYANKTLMQTAYVNRSTWTSIDSYPAACAAGNFVTTIGDTLTCNKPAGNTTSDMVKAVNVSNAIYSFIAKNITGILRDSQVSDTLTCSNLVASSSVVADAEVDDTITASNYVRKNTWTDIDSYPSACSAGYFVSTIGDTLTCTRPSLATQAAGWTNTSTQTTTSLNVGVGTTSPDTLFEVEGTSASEGYIVASIANLKNDGRAELALDTDAGAYAGFIAQAGSATSYGANNMEIGTRVNGGIAFWSYNLERMRLTPTGKLGIGTTVPNSNLHVIGNINATINVTTNRIYASGNITTRDMVVLKRTGTAYITRMYLNASGDMIVESG